VRRALAEESPLGNLVADLMRQVRPEADVTLTNGGGLRADLPSGPLSYGALYEAMPFDNRLVKIQLTAAELIRVLSVHVSHDEHGLVSVSGVRVKASCQGGTLSMRLTRSDGRAIAENARLTLVTSDYLATGGDRLFAPIDLARSRIEPLGDVLMRDALAAEFNRRGRIDPRDKRLFDPAQPRIDLPSKRPVSCARP
jgi:2',3'-cyclic-nucleotide 2'-phosphodiesterase (5'-nucleotidase family)